MLLMRMRGTQDVAPLLLLLTFNGLRVLGIHLLAFACGRIPVQPL